MMQTIILFSAKNIVRDPLRCVLLFLDVSKENSDISSVVYMRIFANLSVHGSFNSSSILGTTTFLPKSNY